MQAYILEELTSDSLFTTLNELLSSDSDDEEPQRGGSRPGRAANIDRNRLQGAQRLFEDYFSSEPVYNEALFKRRFRISRRSFFRIYDVLKTYRYFTQRRDCTGKLGLTGLQKATAAMRCLAYGCASDSVDEYLRIGSSTTDQCLQEFVTVVVDNFADEYLRSPTEEDLKRILRRSEKRGFPGMLGSLDCCKWVWKNCPTAWHGQFEGKEGVPTITLEAIADDSLWIWHAFFGMPGSCNDINVLDCSPLLSNIANGSYPPPIEYNICGQRRNVPYWMVDGIYPMWPCFLHTILEPLTAKEKMLSKGQEGARKDVERAFGVLQGKWHIISRPGRFWSKSLMHKIMKCVIILHNIGVEEREVDSGRSFDEQELAEDVTIGDEAMPMWGSLESLDENTVVPPGSLASLCNMTSFTMNATEYYNTRKLVMDHLWEEKGASLL